MCKYKMEHASIDEYTERARFRSQTDRRRDGHGKPVYLTLIFVEAGV